MEALEEFVACRFPVISSHLDPSSTNGNNVYQNKLIKINSENSVILQMYNMVIKYIHEEESVFLRTFRLVPHILYSILIDGILFMHFSLFNSLCFTFFYSYYLAFQLFSSLLYCDLAISFPHSLYSHLLFFLFDLNSFHR